MERNDPEKLDRLDLRILDLLQEDAGLSNAEIAESVGLSPNACWRRTRRLEERGIIRKGVALLSQEKPIEQPRACAKLAISGQSESAISLGNRM